MIHTAYLLPATALIAWSLVMWLWMYATRLPAIMKSGQSMDPMKPKSELLSFLPAQVRAAARGFKHRVDCRLDVCGATRDSLAGASARQYNQSALYHARARHGSAVCYGFCGGRAADLKFAKCRRLPSWVRRRAQLCLMSR